jgi:hypothetical protein
MNEQQEDQLGTLKEIRSIMERSSRFLSLSGLIGVLAGLAAITGIIAAYVYLDLSITDPGYYKLALQQNGEPNHAVYTFFIVDIVLVFLVSLLAATVLTLRKAKRQQEPVWDATAKRLLINLALPILVGATYCLILLYHGHLSFIAPATLIFYGLALLNASKYTFSDIRYLGMLQIITGLIAAVFYEYALLFWAFGFGVLHIVYGIVVYVKYDK